MSHSNSTANYSLPQFIGSDKPTFLGDINTAYSQIDAQMKLNADGVLSASGKADTAQETANEAQASAQESVQKADQALAVANAKINASAGAVASLYIADEAVTEEKIDASSVFNIFYPVGSYYETSNADFDPNTAWGGTWALDSEGRVTVSQDNGTFSVIGGMGGEENHVLTVAELPAHTHTVAGRRGNTADGGNSFQGRSWSGTDSSIASSSTGNGVAHNNLQPYVVVKRWHRTA